MACIVWELPNGERFLIAEGQAHKPPLGAFNTGVVDYSCKGSVDFDEVDKMMQSAGIKWGTAIKFVTQKLGIRQCSGCKAREVILNNIKEVGLAETVRQLKDTF